MYIKVNQRKFGSTLTLITLHYLDLQIAEFTCSWTWTFIINRVRVINDQPAKFLVSQRGITQCRNIYIYPLGSMQPKAKGL